ncbi:hypothetical protein [uncultured Arenimonas sp.]|uniref:hypothetical protein n=1 Tax=uncultured Arenimonas sp. TaxID=546226 RepID=UPI0030DAF501
MNKKLLAGAIAGLLVSANAGAVVLGTDPARRYAVELTKPVLLTDAADDVEFELGYNFSPSEVRYGRFECTSNIEIDAPVVVSGDPANMADLRPAVAGPGGRRCRPHLHHRLPAVHHLGPEL